MIQPIGKRGREYEKWRQGWIERDQLSPLAPECVVPGLEDNARCCARCRRLGRPPPIGFIVKEDRRWKVVNQVLELGHKQSRQSHPEMKMDDNGVEWQCRRCNSEMGGERFKEGLPQWGRRSDR